MRACVRAHVRVCGVHCAIGRGLYVVKYAVFLWAPRKEGRAAGEVRQCSGRAGARVGAGSAVGGRQARAP